MHLTTIQQQLKPEYEILLREAGKSNAGTQYEATLNVVKFGFEFLQTAFTAVTAGDVKLNGPTSPIGVTLNNKPPDMPLTTLNKRKLIISLQEIHPTLRYEYVNIQLYCNVSHNGPEVQATFVFAPDGQRSRLQRDTSIDIKPPQTIETMPLPKTWNHMGLFRYPVIRIPISIHIDRLWPLSNYNEYFELVLSGLYGFGTDGSGMYKAKRSVRWN